MNDYLSYKIRFISFLLMIMVVFLHAADIIISIGDQSVLVDNKWNFYIQSFISQGITRCAVPLFFLISSYLFFLKTEPFLNKLRKRVKTLLIPYLLWSFWGILFYFVLQLIPYSKPFFVNHIIKDYSFTELLATWLLHPIPYQLWFIRDLMLLVLLSPLLRYMIRIPYISFILFFAVWLSDFDLIVVGNESLLFFFTGGFLSVQKVKLSNPFFTKNSLLLAAIWLIFIALTHIVENVCWDRIGICFGIFSVWFLYDRLSEKVDLRKMKYSGLLSYSFFVYVFHEPLLTIFKKGLYYLLGYSGGAALFIYFFSSITVIAISIIIGVFLKRNFNPFYKLITGGR